MPLGSALTSTIDIDFSRAQGSNPTGRITFEPPRIRIGTTMIARSKVEAVLASGLATINLARLPSGTYRAREEIDGKAPYEFDFFLPMSSPATVQYEEIAKVSSVPNVYTVVRSVNGVLPNPITGDVAVAGGGGGATTLDALTDVTVASPINAQSLVYDSLASQWRNLQLTAGDVGASAVGHTHSIANVTGLQTELDGKAATSHTHSIANVTGLQTALDAKAPSSHTHTISNITGLQAALDAKAGTEHTHTSADITDFETAVSTVAETIAEIVAGDRMLAPRIVRVKDRSKQGAGDFYSLPDTGSSWTLSGALPEYTIQANVGDDIELDYDFQMDQHATAVVDFAVVTGSTPTLHRYFGSGDSTPTYDGLPGIYPASERFQGLNGSTGLTVESGDLDSGFVRIRWAIKTSADNGRIYANNNSPLTIHIVNTRLSGL
jgi:hypothetical protein